MLNTPLPKATIVYVRIYTRLMNDDVHSAKVSNAGWSLLAAPEASDDEFIRMRGYQVPSPLFSLARRQLFPVTLLPFLLRPHTSLLLSLGTCAKRSACCCGETSREATAASERGGNSMRGVKALERCRVQRDTATRLCTDCRSPRRLCKPASKLVPG